jgi:membrane-associated protease RseP (regulator of RpoE activity)
VRPEYESIKGPYYWFKDLFKWLFLLNYFIGLINLFPIYITDGARMLRVAIGKLVKNQEKAIKVWSFINMMFLFLILIGIVSTYLKKVGFF